VVPGVDDVVAAVQAGFEEATAATSWRLASRAAALGEHDFAGELAEGRLDASQRTTPGTLSEVSTLGTTLKKRAADVLAYFDQPRTSNGPTEAINGRLEHLRGSALGFRNLTNYIARSLLETGGSRPRLHPGS
jgi:transposase